MRAHDSNVRSIGRSFLRRAIRKAQQKTEADPRRNRSGRSPLPFRQFPEAQQAYAEIAAKDPKDFHAASQLGYIALLSNKLDDAEPLLRKALDLKHGDADARIMLAEALYRKNDFFHAARTMQGLGPDDASKLKNYATLNVAQLKAFAMTIHTNSNATPAKARVCHSSKPIHYRW